MKKLLLTLALGAALSSCCSEKPDALADNRAFVKEMEVGWNLGNTLDAKGADETAWHNPVTTKEMIDFVHAQGFKTLRVPTTWQFHLGGAPDYKIEEAWLNRVEEIVNYGLDNDMYVIVNIHHDEDIIEPSYAKLDESILIVKSIWQQVADRFQKYDNHVIFETLNEMRVTGIPEEWSGGTPEGRDCVNKLHAAAISTIRATGGNNAERKIMVSAYAGSPNKVAIEAVEFPAGDKNLIASVHSYCPTKFSLPAKDPKVEWGTEEDKAEVDAMLDLIRQVFDAKGVPAVMGEWGSVNNNNDEARARHAAYYAKACIDRGICPVVWDDGGSFQILDRRNLEWKRKGMADGIVGAIK